MAQAASPAPPRATSTRSKSRSRSASSAGSSRSRSRSRERGASRRSSRRSRGRSRSTSRARHASSRRSHRSRSRSASRERGGRRGRDRHDHHSSRHRDRSRSRSRERGRHRRHSGSSRKRSRRERSRSTEGGRRRRDSSPRDDDYDHGRRQRRRRGSDAHATDNEKVSVVQATSSSVPSQPEVSKQAKTVNGTSDVAKHEAAEKEETPTSQDSVATSTATATASSQSDTEITPKPLQPTGENDAREQVEQFVGIAQAAKKSPPTAVKVDVKSIKMDILKALADARSTIAGIKGAVPSASPAPTTVLNPTSPPQAPKPETIMAVAPETTTDITALPASESTHHVQPLPVVAVNPPQLPQDSTADADEFDMFSAAELHGAGLPLSPAAAPATLVVGSAVQSNFDDADGYYKPNIGEILNSKYRVMGTVGKGVFSTVLRCQRLASTGDDSDIVAIKLIRNNDIMREASQTEIKILTDLSQRDPRDKKHCVRLLERFEHRNHVALVFESMQMNVREAMKKFGGKGGISIQAVRIFCKHLLIALTHLEACGIVHADIKPDNVLLDEKQTMIKLCDFGSAFEAKEGKHDPTPYLVSRFYRAPEIVLGLRYDKAVDMWSVGCCLYEMFTGKVMFPGATNNEMLKLFMELKGKVPNKIIKKHRQAYIEQFQMEPHFTEENKFCSHEIDRVTGKPVLRLMDAMKTRFDLGSALLSAKSSTDDRKQVLELKNLLERMFTLDPTKRITPKEALAHPFVKTEGKQAA